jgi:hypothetical protein
MQVPQEILQLVIALPFYALSIVALIYAGKLEKLVGTSPKQQSDVLGHLVLKWRIAVLLDVLLASVGTYILFGAFGALAVAAIIGTRYLVFKKPTGRTCLTSKKLVALIEPFFIKTADDPAKQLKITVRKLLQDKRIEKDDALDLLTRLSQRDDDVGQSARELLKESLSS